MSYRVRTGSFDGPFDLLLYLVSRQRVDIGSVSISQIADQYVDEVSRMKRLDLNVASDFLLVASTLLEIKAHSLLREDMNDDDQEIRDLGPDQARQMLIERLLVYKKFKNAAAAFERRFEVEGRVHTRSFGPDESLLHVMPDYLEGVTIDQIARTCADTFARRDTFLLESDHIAKKPIPVETHVQSIYHRLRHDGTVRFSSLVGDETPTPIIVVTFLAILELYKRNLADIRQERSFGDIVVMLRDGAEGPDGPESRSHSAERRQTSDDDAMPSAQHRSGKDGAR